MDLQHIFSAIMNLSTLVFVVTSMLVMGLSLTMAQILAPLRNTRLVLAALAANFILAPALAYGIGRLMPLSDGHQHAGDGTEPDDGSDPGAFAQYPPGARSPGG